MAWELGSEVGYEFRKILMIKIPMSPSSYIEVEVWNSAPVHSEKAPYLKYTFCLLVPYATCRSAAISVTFVCVELKSSELGAEDFPALIFHRLFGSGSASESGSLALAPLLLFGSRELGSGSQNCRLSRLALYQGRR